MTDIDLVRLNFNPQTLLLLNVVLGLRHVRRRARPQGGGLPGRADARRAPVLIGLAGHSSWCFRRSPSCWCWCCKPRAEHRAGHDPGLVLSGRQHLELPDPFRARQHRAVGVDQHGVSTLAAIVMTPLNIALLGRAVRAGAADPAPGGGESAGDVPARVPAARACRWPRALLVSRRWPRFTARARKPMKIFSLVFFLALRARRAGSELAVFPALRRHGGRRRCSLHNALGAGHRLRRRPFAPACRSATGARCRSNAASRTPALGLILIFNFFDGLGGMAIVAAWWGIWHIVAGLSLATFWSRRPPRSRDGAWRERPARPRHRRGRLSRLAAGRGAGGARRSPSAASSRWTCATCRRSAVPPASSTCQADVRSPAARRRSSSATARGRGAPGVDRHAGQGQQARIRILGRRRSAPRTCSKACVAAGVRDDHRHLQRRGLRLPRRQPGLDHRGPAAARQRGLRLLLAQAAGRGDAGALAHASIPSWSRWCFASAPSSARR